MRNFIHEISGNGIAASDSATHRAEPAVDHKFSDHRPLRQFQRDYHRQNPFRCEMLTSPLPIQVLIFRPARLAPRNDQ
jgi:hypothetical protein